MELLRRRLFSDNDYKPEPAPHKLWAVVARLVQSKADRRPFFVYCVDKLNNGDTNWRWDIFGWRKWQISKPYNLPIATNINRVDGKEESEITTQHGKHDLRYETE